MRNAGSMILILASVACLSGQQPKSLMIEDLTWTEVRDAIAAGKTTAIYYAGSIEQNGPGVALGKHLFLAHYLAQQIAERLGNALAYPTMPFAPTGDPIKKTGHMRLAGSVNVSAETFGAVARDVALSAISAGFKNIVFIEDHGGPAQTTLGKVAEELNAEWGPKGTHVYHIPDLYFKEKEAMKDYMAKHDLPYDSHAGTDDTSEVMFIDKDHKWIRPDKLIKDTGGPSGVNGDQTKATIEMGKMFTDYKIQFAVAQIKKLVN